MTSLFSQSSSYKSASRPSFLKTSSSTACYKTVARDKCAVDYTMLGKDVLNQNSKCEQKILDTFEKSKEIPVS